MPLPMISRGGDRRGRRPAVAAQRRRRAGESPASRRMPPAGSSGSTRLVRGPRRRAGQGRSSRRSWRPPMPRRPGSPAGAIRRVAPRGRPLVEDRPAPAAGLRHAPTRGGPAGCGWRPRRGALAPPGRGRHCNLDRRGTARRGGPLRSANGHASASTAWTPGDRNPGGRGRDAHGPGARRHPPRRSRPHEPRFGHRFCISEKPSASTSRTRWRKLGALSRYEAAAVASTRACSDLAAPSSSGGRTFRNWR